VQHLVDEDELEAGGKRGEVSGRQQRRGI